MTTNFPLPGTGFHNLVRFDYLLEVVDALHRYDRRPGGDSVEKVL